SSEPSKHHIVPSFRKPTSTLGVLYRTTLFWCTSFASSRCASLFAIPVVFTNRRLQSPLSNVTIPTVKLTQEKLQAHFPKNRKRTKGRGQIQHSNRDPDKCYQQVRLRGKQLAAGQK
ncbi:unnamed protein product, partial [Ectocarpus sp. 4 AP-2014]